MNQKQGAGSMREQEARPARGRFAPSPSGRLHLGNLLSFLLAWLDVRSLGGAMVLRMEDLDPERCKPEYALQLAEDLRWLGLDWDEGWDGRDPGSLYAQSNRNGYYEEAFAALEARGLIYPCYCTRAERLAVGAPHPGEREDLCGCRCPDLTREERQSLERAGRRPAYRIRVPYEEIAFCDGHFGNDIQNLKTDCGDFILRRSDGVYAYQLAVTVDDRRMGITRVVRGRDLLSSTPRQIWLHRLLGGSPPDYCHVPLLLSGDGRRLSKRERDLDMGALRKRFTPEQLTGWLAFLAGLSEIPEPVPAAELVSGFSWASVRREDIRLPSGFC